MDSNLQQILRNLCLNTEWKYAVFWKLKHGARTVLTWEDVYCADHEQNPPEFKCLSETSKNLPGCCSHDPLGLAVAKMSYHIYSLGEGIVGQVAVSGKHQWIFAENVNNSYLSSELYDGWQSQFSAGIKTILFVAVGPRGVIQLGSLNTVHEDMTQVTRIRDLFSALKDSSAGHITNLLQCILPNLPQKGIVTETVPDCIGNVDKAAEKDESQFGLPASHYTIKQNGSHPWTFPLPYVNLKKAVGGTKFESAANVINLKHQNQVGMDFVNHAFYEGETSHVRGLIGPLDHNIHTDSSHCVLDNAVTYSSCSSLVSAASDTLKIDDISPYENQAPQLSESFDHNYLIDLEKKLESRVESSHFDATSASVSFFAGSELLEALGPAFLRGSKSSDGEAEKTEAEATIDLTEDINSQLTFDSGQENLLEAVIANVCHRGSDVKHEMSSNKSLQSLLTTDKMVEPSSQKRHFISAVGCSINEPFLTEGNTPQSSSEICGAFSSIGFSSTCPSACSEQLERSMEVPKKNKKRAKPGENSRPRPRDRQLIQDRIKELRELVPNGSKCSIDSLLERTIKHMLFLQSVAKHADRLSKYAEIKMQQKATGILGSSNCEQGSSWAVEVGGHLKVCSIVVENLNKQGLMLIEMLCEECSHFLEIAEAIRSLGLAVLKGVTEAHGEKTWICFVVEGQNNKVMHRMDILWSLVQIFQPKATGKAVAAS